MNENQNEYVDINAHDNYPDSEQTIEIPTMKVIPLKKICMTIGELPTSYLETMTYYEMLIWFIEYLKNNIIPTINNNANAVQEVQAVVLELQNYINDYKDSIDSDVEELEEYMNNYFENLDVQEEINNKLDEYVEDGTLEHIIASYLNTQKIYNTHEEMIADAESLVDGLKIQTLGYHSIYDGGGAFYYITDTESQTDYQEEVGSLYATMIISNDTVNVKQFGAYGDNTHDDTTAFTTALSVGKKLIIPKATYSVDHVNFIDGSKVDGMDSIINTAISSTALNGIGNNCTIKNLTINSTNADREWNRIDMTNKGNIIIDNCTFSGFRQVTESGPNVWALYFKNSKNVRVTNCYFDNNSFEDIIVEYNCENIYFNNLRSSNALGVNIDIEPSSNNNLYNILFENCTINIFRTTDYRYEGNNTNNVTCINCILNGFKYHGGDLTLINCNVSSYDGLIVSDMYFGGPIKIIQSANFSDNLIEDCYFNDISKTSGRGYWWISYNTGQWADMVKNIKDDGGYAIALNPSNSANNVILESPYIDVTPEQSYMLKTLSKSYFPSNSINPTLSVRITFYDNSNTQLRRNLCSIDRHPLSTTSNYSEQNIIFKTPENCTKIKIEYRNGQGSAPQSLYLKATGLYRISPNEKGQSNEPAPFETVTKRIISSDNLPNTNSINYNVGDLLYYKTPSTHIGAVCTSDSGQGGTWSNFGSISQ